MVAISKSKHSKLIIEIKALAKLLPIATCNNDHLQKTTAQLEQFFEDYTFSLLKLGNLIKKYETTERLVKLAFRKQQLFLLKQKIASAL